MPSCDVSRPRPHLMRLTTRLPPHVRAGQGCAGRGACGGRRWLPVEALEEVGRAAARTTAVQGQAGDARCTWHHGRQGGSGEHRRQWRERQGEQGRREQGRREQGRREYGGGGGARGGGRGGRCRRTFGTRPRGRPRHARCPAFPRMRRRAAPSYMYSVSCPFPLHAAAVSEGGRARAAMRPSTRWHATRRHHEGGHSEHARTTTCFPWQAARTRTILCR